MKKAPPGPPPGDGGDDDGDLFSYARRKRDEGMDRVERNAGPTFAELARAFVLEYLEMVSHESGEVIVNKAKENGIVPHNDRAFGPVFLKLLKDKLIEKDGTTARFKGHAAPGATIWKLA